MPSNRARTISIVAACFTCALLLLTLAHHDNLPEPLQDWLAVDDRVAAAQTRIAEWAAPPPRSPEPLPPCKRVLLVDYGSYNYGFGAAQLAMIQAAYFAKRYGYQLLFARDANPYGQYLDYFMPATPTCEATEMDHNIMYCWNNRKDCRTNEDIDDHQQYLELATDRLVFPRFFIWSMNAWTVSTFWDTLDALADLPKLDSTRPLPLNPDEGTLPPLMKVAYEAYEPLFREHFTFNPLMDSLIKARRGDLDDFRLRFDDAPLVGVHFRGGDKIGFECTNSPMLSCGNITMHAEAAWNAVQPYLQDRPGVKPTMALMTAEADAYDKFVNDHVGQRFNIVEMPHEESRTTYEQNAFNAMDPFARLSQTRLMLSNLAALALYADTFVVSGNSNLGRFAMLLAGPERMAASKVVALDLYWFASIFKPVYPVCDGRERCHP